MPPDLLDESACRAALAAARWPNGFLCPACGHDDASYLARRRLHQCRACRRQTSVTAGTALHATKLPVGKWLAAVLDVARSSAAVAARRVQHDLGIGSYRTAWALLHKLRLALGEGPVPVAPETLHAEVPIAVLDKRSRGPTSRRGLLVVAGHTVRAVVGRPPAARVGGGPRASRFFARVVAVLALVHRGIAPTYLASYVRGLVFAHEHGARASDFVGRLAHAPHASVADVRDVGLTGRIREAGA